MPQVVEFPPIGLSGPLMALVRVCKETPAKGEPFREFRSRLRGAKLWDRDRPSIVLRFLGVGGSTVVPSAFMQALATASGDDAIAETVMDRLWHLNPVLGKTVLEMVSQRAYHKDEVYKQLISVALPHIHAKVARSNAAQVPNNRIHRPRDAVGDDNAKAKECDDVD